VAAGGRLRIEVGMADAKAAAVEDEVEVAEVAEGEAGSAKKWQFKLPPLKALIAAGGVAVLILGGAGAYFALFSHPHEAKTETPGVKPVVFVDLPEVVVNLSNPGSDRTQYLKIRIVLELPDQKMIDHIQRIMPRVMDAFQTYLRELRPSDLDGSAGLYRLKEELTRRVNASIAPSQINAVLFKEIVVQ
jgi:flagellar FliL protein